MPIGSRIMRQVAESYRKIRNTSRFVLSNLYDFDYEKDRVAYKEMPELDRWALNRLGRLVARVDQAYKDYEFHVVYHAINGFCTVDMSAVYLDIIKDTLYTSLSTGVERRAAQTVLYEIIHAMVRLLTPILAFTSEEIWQHLRREGDEDSVQLAGWPEVDGRWIDDALEEKWDKILRVREVATKALELARQQKVIGHSLAGDVTIFADETYRQVLDQVGELDSLLIVSKATVRDLAEALEDAVGLPEIPGVLAWAQAADGEKCERCWRYSPSVGSQAGHDTLCSRCTDVLENLE
jgi:isoleucyl-tRNA synthetase